MAHQYPVSRQRSSSLADAHALHYPHYQVDVGHAYPLSMAETRRQSIAFGQQLNPMRYFQQSQAQLSSEYLPPNLDEESATSHGYPHMYTTPYGHRASVSSTASPDYSSGSPPVLSATKSSASSVRRNTGTKPSAIPFHPYMLTGLSSKGRTGQACVECRKRKAKCSGDRPSCTRCIKSPGQGPCVYISASVERDMERVNNEADDSSSSSDESATDPSVSQTAQHGGTDSWRTIPTRNAMYGRTKARGQQSRRSSEPNSSLGLSFDPSPLPQASSHGHDATVTAAHYTPFNTQPIMALEQTMSQPMPTYRYPVQMQPGYSQLAYVPPPAVPVSHHDRIMPQHGPHVERPRYYVPVFQSPRHARSCSAPSVASLLEPSDDTNNARPTPPADRSGSNTSEIVPVAATVIRARNLA